jgi:hypothetical protein
MSHSKISSVEDVQPSVVRQKGDAKQSENPLAFVIIFVAAGALFLFMLNK